MQSCATIRLDMPSCTGPDKKMIRLLAARREKNVIGPFARACLFEPPSGRGVHVNVNRVFHIGPACLWLLFMTIDAGAKGVLVLAPNPPAGAQAD